MEFNLTPEQIGLLNEDSQPNNLSFFGGLYVEDVAKFRFVNALKVAEQLGCLNKQGIDILNKGNKND